MQAATPAEEVRTKDPGLSLAREATEVLPAEMEINISLIFIL